MYCPELPSSFKTKAGIFRQNFVKFQSIKFNPDNSVGIATGYGLDDRGSILERGKILFSTASRPALGPTQPPIEWVPGAISPGVKGPGRETDHSPPSSADVKNGGAIPPLPHMFSW
jgi:hypothetical protein